MSDTVENKEEVMKTKRKMLIATLLAILCGVGIFSKAQALDDTLSLTAKQQGIIPIAAFTASGEMDRLKVALVDGLEAGLSVNEIKEILVQMYAYAGFPRSLNAIFAFMSILDKRKAMGIEDEVGKDASPVPADLNRDTNTARR